MPGTTSDLMRKGKTLFLPQQIFKSIFFAKINNSNVSHDNSLYMCHTWCMLGTILSMVYRITHLNIYLTVATKK